MVSLPRYNLVVYDEGHKNFPEALSFTTHNNGLFNHAATGKKLPIFRAFLFVFKTILIQFFLFEFYTLTHYSWLVEYSFYFLLMKSWMYTKKEWVKTIQSRTKSEVKRKLFIVSLSIKRTKICCSILDFAITM